MNDKKMTVFYKLSTKKMERVCGGIQNLNAIGNLTLDEAKLIWNYFYMDFDEYVFNHLEEFELIEKDDKLSIQMRDSIKENIKKYL